MLAVIVVFGGREYPRVVGGRATAPEASLLRGLDPLLAAGLAQGIEGVCVQDPIERRGRPVQISTVPPAAVGSAIGRLRPRLWRC